MFNCLFSSFFLSFASLFGWAGSKQVKTNCFGNDLKVIVQCLHFLERKLQNFNEISRPEKKRKVKSFLPPLSPFVSYRTCSTQSLAWVYFFSVHNFLPHQIIAFFYTDVCVRACGRVVCRVWWTENKKIKRNEWMSIQTSFIQNELTEKVHAANCNLLHTHSEGVNIYT